MNAEQEIYARTVAAITAAMIDKGYGAAYIAKTAHEIAMDIIYAFRRDLK